MWRLIRVCALRLRPIYGTLGLNGLTLCQKDSWKHFLYVTKVDTQKLVGIFFALLQRQDEKLLDYFDFNYSC